MTSVHKTVLISGSGRGIGRGLVEHFLYQASTTVVAALRNTGGKEARSLEQLGAAEGSRLIIVQIDSTSRTDAKDAIAVLQSQHGVSHIDVVIANAGVCDHLLPVAEIDLDELTRHINTNTYGVLRLFQATWTLLQNGRTPKFICISSILGTLSSSASDGGYTGAYGLSKAAINYAVVKIGAENQQLISFSIDPGLVQTDMGNRGAQFAGLKEAPVTVQQSVDGIVREIETATRLKCQGVFRSYDGQSIPW